IFMDWFSKEILPTTHKTCSPNVVLYVGGSGRASPRNVYLQASGAATGFSSGRISVFAECPDVVFPLGDVEAASSITGTQQELPVAVDVMVAKGCDGVVARLAQELSESGLVV